MAACISEHAFTAQGFVRMPGCFKSVCIRPSDWPGIQNKRAKLRLPFSDWLIAISFIYSDRELLSFKQKTALDWPRCLKIRYRAQVFDTFPVRENEKIM